MPWFAVAQTESCKHILRVRSSFPISVFPCFRACAHAVAEGATLRGSMADHPKSARAVYAVMATALGLASH